MSQKSSLFSPNYKLLLLLGKYQKLTNRSGWAPTLLCEPLHHPRAVSLVTWEQREGSNCT